MTAAISPALALDYLATLWVDLRAAAVLDGAGFMLAGDAAIAGPAGTLVAAAQAGQALRADHDGGVLYAVRSDRHALAVVVSREALEAVIVCDLQAVLADLDGS
jgi:hypothetical protein